MLERLSLRYRDNTAVKCAQANYTRAEPSRCVGYPTRIQAGPHHPIGHTAPVATQQPHGRALPPPQPRARPQLCHAAPAGSDEAGEDQPDNRRVDPAAQEVELVVVERQDLHAARRPARARFTLRRTAPLRAREHRARRVASEKCNCGPLPWAEGSGLPRSSTA